MAEPYQAVARSIAKKLEAATGESIVPFVEAEIDSPGSSNRSTQFTDPTVAIALASLIVSTAGVVWAIARDVIKENQKPHPDFISRKVRMELEIPKGVSQDQVDSIVKIAVEETVTYSH